MVTDKDLIRCVKDYTVYGTKELEIVVSDLELIRKQQNPRLLSMRAFHEYLSIAGYVDKEVLFSTISLN